MLSTHAAVRHVPRPETGCQFLSNAVRHPSLLPEAWLLQKGILHFVQNDVLSIRNDHRNGGDHASPSSLRMLPEAILSKACWPSLPSASSCLR